MSDVIVGIHQPNLLPWLGFFDKIAKSDIFVLLDTVQFSRGSRTNRVQVLAGGEPTWLTAPVRRPNHGEPRIADALIDDSRPWRHKALRTFQVSYGSSPGFTETFDLIEPLLLDPNDRLAQVNEAAIRHIAAELGLARTRFVRAAELDAQGERSELLASIVAAVGGTTYLSGAGAGGYLEEAPFRRRGIEVRIQRFCHPDYPQPAREPVHGLSVVDAMMSVGPANVRRFLR
jgi:hypothetical protein